MPSLTFVGIFVYVEKMAKIERRTQMWKKLKKLVLKYFRINIWKYIAVIPQKFIGTIKFENIANKKNIYLNKRKYLPKKNCFKVIKVYFWPLMCLYVF